MDFDKLWQAAAENPVATIIAVTAIAVVLPVVGMLRTWLINRNPAKHPDDVTPLGLLIAPALAAVALCVGGCALFAPKYDPISEQHAREALDTIERDLNPELTETQRKIAVEQAREWVKYETSKGE